MVDRPDASEFAPFYAGYVAHVPETDVLRVLEAQPGELEACARLFRPPREQFRYAPGKWSVREVVGHITDAERVFGFRAFCFSRGDRNPLPSFDENEYVVRSGFDAQPLAELVDEFALVRRANLARLRQLDAEAWQQIGTASGKPISVRALAYIMAGHVRHHLHLLETSYAA
jgi:hypothetical protein